MTRTVEPMDYTQPAAEPSAAATPPTATQQTAASKASRTTAASSQAAEAPNAAPRPIGHSLIIEGSREVADVWDWNTFTGREWFNFSEGRWNELLADELVTAEHWRLGRTQLAARPASEAEEGRATATAEGMTSQQGGQP